MRLRSRHDRRRPDPSWTPAGPSWTRCTEFAWGWQVTRPLSFAQSRMWFSTQLEPDSSMYHRPLVLRLRGPLDPSILERSLNEIVRRHEVLRTRYPARAGSPWQEVIPAQRVHLPLVDLSRLPAVERDAQAKDLADREFRRPFDLSQGLPLRARLLRLALEEHVLLLVIHHIAFDGWSTQVLLRELGALYQAFIAGCS
ncbi:MAG TPA: condensation domain-containing protein, partial [Rubrobacter sp.]|nr:condensation domain-containing protein [Rubrobacter sp.]